MAVIRRWRPVVMALAVAAGALLGTVMLRHVGLFAVLELKGQDLLFELRGPLPAPQQVVVVAIDEPSFAELQLQWPWPRSLHGRLLRQLAEAGAVVVGMDILFSEASDPKEDESFAQALHETGKVVLASEHAVVNDPLFRQVLRADPISIFHEAAAVGVPILLLDSDGTVRRTRLSLAQTPSFALRVAQEYLTRLTLTKSQRARAALEAKGWDKLPVEVLINHLGPPRTVTTASYYQALDYEHLLPPDFFAGKVVLVGRSLVTVPEPQQLLGDTFLTPFSWLGMGPTSGVELQATIVSNLLEGRFPTKLSGVARAVLLFVFFALASLLLTQLKPVVGLLATVVLAGLILVLSYEVFVHAALVPPIVAGVAGLVLVYGAHLLLRTLRAERARRLALEEANRQLEGQVVLRTQELTSAHQELSRRHGDLQIAYRDLARTQEQLIQSEKMASLGLLVAGVAHELNNPISYVSNNLEFIEEYTERLAGIIEAYGNPGPATGGGRRGGDQRRDTDRFDATRETLQELIASCKEGADRVKKIVLDLRAFSRTDDIGQVPADLHAGLESTLNLLGKQYQDRIRAHRDYGELPEVECYPGQINQVFMNLLQNAVQAIPAAGDLWITTRSEGDWVTVSILDNGGGIPQENLSKVFDPFFTTKPVGAGTGLGLSISYGIIKKHGGRIRAHSRLNEGTEFVVELPVRAKGEPHETT